MYTLYTCALTCNRTSTLFYCRLRILWLVIYILPTSWIQKSLISLNLQLVCLAKEVMDRSTRAFIGARYVLLCNTHPLTHTPHPCHTLSQTIHTMYMLNMSKTLKEPHNSTIHIRNIHRSQIICTNTKETCCDPLVFFKLCGWHLTGLKLSPYLINLFTYNTTYTRYLLLPSR